MALLLLAGCTTGGLGDIFGTGTGSGSTTSQLRGTVDYVDLNERSILLTNVSGGNVSMLSSGGSTVRVYFDDQTAVQYQGQTYRPADLERGDQIDVSVEENGNRLMATSVQVVRDVSGSTTSSSPTDTRVSTLRGTVRNVDTSRRTIELEQTSWRSGFVSGSNATTVVQYDANTGVEFDGQTHPVANLERGDVVDIEVRNAGGSTFIAQRVYLVRDVRR